MPRTVKFRLTAGRSVPVERRNVPATFGTTCTLTIPHDRDPDLTDQDFGRIEAGDVVVVETQPEMTAISTHRFGRAIGQAIDRGAAAVVIDTPTRSGKFKLVCWSASPLYRIGDTFGIDVTV